MSHSCRITLVAITTGAGAFLGPVPTTVSAQCEEVKLTASDAEAGDQFGGSVSVSEDVAVIGASRDDHAGEDSGSAYVYRRDGTSWPQEQKLTASDGGPEDRFGGSVSISENYAVVGATHYTGGSAYIYRWNGTTWVEEWQFYPGVITSVSISGDVVMVGVTDPWWKFWTVRVYRRNGTSWVEEQELTPSDPQIVDHFGFCVLISGDVAVVGAPWHDGMAGAAYMYRWNETTWVEEQKLTALDAAPGEEFGSSVSLSASLAVVGAPRDNEAGDGSGSAYVFRWNGSAWVEEQKLTASDAAEGDAFGRSVSISGPRIVVGAYSDDDAGSDSGAAYLYRFDGAQWVEQYKLTASDAEASDVFGRSVSISGDIALVGAPGNDDAGSGSGSGYVYDIAGCAPAIPTVSQWGLVVMTLLFLTVGTVVIARRWPAGRIL